MQWCQMAVILDQILIPLFMLAVASTNRSTDSVVTDCQCEWKDHSPFLHFNIEAVPVARNCVSFPANLFFSEDNKIIHLLHLYTKCLLYQHTAQTVTKAVNNKMKTCHIPCVLTLTFKHSLRRPELQPAFEHEYMAIQKVKV